MATFEAILGAEGAHPVIWNLHAVVNRHAVARPGDARRQGIAQSQSVGELAQGVQPDVGHHPGPPGFHRGATSAVTVHFGSALLVGKLADSRPTVSPTGRAYPRTRTVQLKWPREEAGLASGGNQPPFFRSIRCPKMCWLWELVMIITNSASVIR
jgi:hypothetical protein